MLNNNHDYTSKDPSDYRLLYQHLRSGLLSPHRRLQQAATKGSKQYVKRGEEGPHIRALQKALNRALHFNRKRWAQLDTDGDFGSKTFAALKACQDFLNRRDRKFALSYARDDATNFKLRYNQHRTRIKSDGIAGPATLKALDLYIYTHWMPPQTN